MTNATNVVPISLAGARGAPPSVADALALAGRLQLELAWAAPRLWYATWSRLMSRPAAARIDEHPAAACRRS